MTELVCYHAGNLSKDRGDDRAVQHRTEKELAVHHVASRLWDAYMAGKCVLHLKRMDGRLCYLVRWKQGCKP